LHCVRTKLLKELFYLEEGIFKFLRSISNYEITAIVVTAVRTSGAMIGPYPTHTLKMESAGSSEDLLSTGLQGVASQMTHVRIL
jgi:hypothetical protein